MKQKIKEVCNSENLKKYITVGFIIGAVTAIILIRKG